MINKFSKIIHSKNLKIFQFFFYLRYLFAVFLISILLFLLIPKFLNFDEKQEIINKNLDNHYNLQINNFSSINFKIFPLPNLYISNADLKVSNKPINFRVKDFRIYLKLKNIYNQKNLIPK